MEKQNCTAWHNLQVTKDLIVICPDIPDKHNKEMVEHVARWYNKDTHRKITYIVCQNHLKNYTQKDILPHHTPHEH